MSYKHRTADPRARTLSERVVAQHVDGLLRAGLFVQAPATHAPRATAATGTHRAAAAKRARRKRATASRKANRR